MDITGLHKEVVSISSPIEIGDLNRMMQSATEHSMERLGMSVSDLLEWNLLWVICFSQINILRMPKPGERIEIYTWPGAEKMGMYTRRYVFFTESGEELLNAASMFSLVDQKTRTMVLPSKADFIFPVVQMPGENKLPKLNVKNVETKEEMHHQVDDSEIDINAHVNNAFYLDWCSNIMEKKALKRKEQIESIWISYAREIRKGDEVILRYAMEEDSLFVKGYVQSDSSFTVRIVFNGY